MMTRLLRSRAKNLSVLTWVIQSIVSFKPQTIGINKHISPCNWVIADFFWGKPYKDGEGWAILDAIMFSEDIIPRLRRLANERRFPRSAMCNYLGLHTNSLSRLDDDSWAPRLSTVRRIEGFLQRFEHQTTRTLGGASWRLLYDTDKRQWWVRARDGTTIGPYADPDIALTKGQEHFTVLPPVHAPRREKRALAANDG